MDETADATKYSLSPHQSFGEDPSLPCSRISLMIWPPLTWVCWRRVSVYVLHGTSAHKMPFSAMKLEMQPRIVLSGGCW